MSKSRLTAYLYLIIVAAIWGAAGPVIKYTLVALPPVIFLTLRFFLTCLVLVPIFLVKRQKLPDNWRDWGMLLLVGFLGSTVNLLLLFWGYTKTTALDGSLLSDLSPIFVVAGGALFLKEVISRRELWGLGLVIAGTIMTVLQPILEKQAFGLENVGGNVLVMLANVVWVAYVLMSKVQLGHKYSPLTITTISFAVGFVTLFPAAIIQAGSMGDLIQLLSHVPLASQGGVWFMGLLSGALLMYSTRKGKKGLRHPKHLCFHTYPRFLRFLWLYFG